MIADVIRCASVMTIRRVRQLPFPGEVLVHEGEHVGPDDIIARADLPGEVLSLDFARGLGVQAEEAHRYLVRDVGEEVVQDDVIAESEEKTPRLFRTPVSGRIVASYQGRVTLETGTKELRIRAGMIGTIDAVIPEYGAVVSVRGSLVQGLWGNDKIGQGQLHVWNKALMKPLQPSKMTPLAPGALLAAGQCLHVDVLVRAAEKELAGLILGSLAPELIPAVKALAMPVIVLQGFGPMSLDQDLFSSLKIREGVIACVNATAVDAYAGERPEVIIPNIEQEKDTAHELGFRVTLQIGQQVRVMSGSAVGQTGVLVALSTKRIRFESGLESFSAVIRLVNGDTIQVPCQNLVIIQ